MSPGESEVLNELLDDISDDISDDIEDATDKKDLRDIRCELLDISNRVFPLL